MSAETTVAVIAAFIAVFSMIAAIVQSNQARRQTSLQQRALEDAAQPYIWVDIRPDERNASFFHLILKNEGPTVAQNVRVTINPPLPTNWGHGEPIGPRHQDFSSIPPGRRMIWNLGVTHEIVNSDTVKEFTITIAADGPHGPVLPYTYKLNIDQYKYNSMFAPGTLSAISKSIDNLTTATKK